MIGIVILMLLIDKFAGGFLGLIILFPLIIPAMIAEYYVRELFKWIKKSIPLSE